MDAHINRLRAGLATLGWPDVLPDTVDRGVAAVTAAFAPHITDIRLRITVCYETEPGESAVYIHGQRYVPPSDAAYARGVDAVVTEYTVNAASPLTQLKTGQRLPFMLARAEAQARSAWEGLLLTPDGSLADGSVANVHFVVNNTIVTPDAQSGALPGIARQTVQQLAAVHGISWQATRCTVAMLAQADEAFLTNSLVGVLPLVRLDGQAVGAGSPGPITRRIRALYEARRRSRARLVNT